MNLTTRLAVLVVLLPLAALASVQQFSAAFTFVCKGLEGQGNCPNGGDPTSLTQGRVPHSSPLLA
jgi:hypothetical protein